MITSSFEESEALGKKIGNSLSAGDVLLLYGDLGAGKTTLVKGIASSFGIDPETVTSPTFVLVNEYVGTRKIFHIDLYRLESSKEVSDIGIEEYFDKNGITIIEWPEKITKIDAILSQEKIKKIYIDQIDKNKRKFTLSFNL